MITVRPGFVIWALSECNNDYVVIKSCFLHAQNLLTTQKPPSKHFSHLLFTFETCRTDIHCQGFSESKALQASYCIQDVGMSYPFKEALLSYIQKGCLMFEKNNPDDIIILDPIGTNTPFTPGIKMGPDLICLMHSHYPQWDQIFDLQSKTCTWAIWDSSESAPVPL